MLASPASFKISVEKLVRRVEAEKLHYLSKSYSEAQARVDFISPFFRALGYARSRGRGSRGNGGRPDYGFRVAGQTKFFVEAKAPSEELDTAKHIIQAKSYA